MIEIAVQYLEDTPGVPAISPGEARARLRNAFTAIPISYVLIGWNLHAQLLGACREETFQGGAQFFRWHPLLTGDGSFTPDPGWRTVGLQGEPVPGFRGLPEFTFMCPNKPAVHEAALERLQQVIQTGDYDGVFLDRIRFPSPGVNPLRWLACFCDDCHRVASTEGLDLDAVRQDLHRLLERPDGWQTFVRELFGEGLTVSAGCEAELLRDFLHFRMRSVTRFVRAAADLIRAGGLCVALDCFSPTLTRMVGQDLGSLDDYGIWTKVMSYAHALGPAGLPYEFLDISGWLMERQRLSERRAMEWLSEAAGLSLPFSRDELRNSGLESASLVKEMEKAREAGVKNLFAGIELVEMPGVAHLNPEQIQNDLNTLRLANPDGLVLSWDLWHIPLERLELVSRIFA